MFLEIFSNIRYQKFVFQKYVLHFYVPRKFLQGQVKIFRRLVKFLRGPVVKNSWWRALCWRIKICLYIFFSIRLSNYHPALVMIRKNQTYQCLNKKWIISIQEQSYLISFKCHGMDTIVFAKHARCVIYIPICGYNKSPALENQQITLFSIIKSVWSGPSVKNWRIIPKSGDRCHQWSITIKPSSSRNVRVYKKRSRSLDQCPYEEMSTSGIDAVQTACHLRENLPPS